MRVIFSSVSAALSDPESDNHRKNQPKNHGWISSVAASFNHQKNQPKNHGWIC